MNLRDLTTPGIDDLTLAWTVTHLRLWSWFPDFFGDPAQGGVSRIERVHALNAQDFATTERLQVGGLLLNNPTVVSDTQRERMEIFFGYTFETTTHVVADDAVTYHTVLRELVGFLRTHPTLGGHVRCLVEVRILGVGGHLGGGGKFRNLALVQATYELLLHPDTQRPLIPAPPTGGNP